MFWWELTFSSILLIGDIGLGYQFTRRLSPQRLAFLVLIYCVIAVALGWVLAPDNFGFLRLAAHGVFLHLPLVLLSASIFYYLNWLRWFCFIIALVISIIGVDAFFIEPYSIEVNRHELRFEKLNKAMRIVVLADIQTDQIGKYEAKVIDLALAQNPDIIIMPGDFVQLKWGEKRTEILASLNTLLKKKKFTAPLGVFAVGGNVDYCDWAAAFEDMNVTVFDQLYTANQSEFSITGMHLWDSYNSELEIKQTTNFHIAVGHVPDFALSKHVHADLLIAGHTHGGQVQLPFIGPLLTLCEIPRGWAQGITELENGKVLAVSRGIGMERENAPRLRFLCKPEIVVLDLLP